MPYSVNKVILLGNVGKDPSITYTGSGIPVASFSIATTEKWKDAEGAAHEKTEWHQVVAWRKLAEIVGQYLTKGSKVYIEGKLETQSWDDKESGQKKYKTQIVAHDLVMLSSKQGGEDGGTQIQGGGPAQPDDTPF